MLVCGSWQAYFTAENMMLRASAVSACRNCAYDKHHIHSSKSGLTPELTYTHLWRDYQRPLNQRLKLTRRIQIERPRERLPRLFMILL